MKKGFTLIELLAVIVILAIIAVIAVPIVLNIINDAKESAVLRSADFYLDGVEKSIATSVLNDLQIKDGTYSVMPDANICIGTLDDNVCTGDILKIEIDGQLPKEGKVKIKEGKIVKILLQYDNGFITKKDNKLVFEKKINLKDYIDILYNPTKTTTVNDIEYSLDEIHQLMNDRLGSKDVEKTEGNIRYYGKNPNNYIDIGDRDSEGNIIFWRIIGLFKDIEVTDEEGNVVKTEDLVKIIRSDYLTSGTVKNFSWDYISTGTYDNNWKESTLQLMLNDEVNGYYGSGITNYYNYKSGQDPTPIELDFTSTGLSSKAYDKIERVNWILGGYKTNGVYVDVMYKYERTGTNKWSGKIALMNSSDYGYSGDLSYCQSTLYHYSLDACKTTTWLYDSNKSQWTLNPFSSNKIYVFFVHSTGAFSDTDAKETYIIRPVLYLKSDIGIVEEKETSEGLKYLVVK